MSIRIKICGITSVHDAKLALNAGADYLGLIFVPGSPRGITVEEAKCIRDECPAAHWVGVFQNAAPKVVQEALSTLNLDLAQLHGDEQIADYQTVGPLVQVIQNLAFPIVSYPGIQYVLLDRSKSTPQQDWIHQLRQFVMSHPELPPFWIAGGLTPDNVAEAIQAVNAHPAFCGVDVASGVESAPGQKDPDKLTAFCAAVRGLI